MAKEFTRRSLLGAAAAGMAGSIAARAQVSGLTPDGGTPPFRLALGALDFLDRKSYIHNMEIHATLAGSTISGGEPLMAMCAKSIRCRASGAGGGLLCQFARAIRARRHAAGDSAGAGGISAKALSALGE